MCDERIRATLMAGQIRCSYYSPRGQEIVAAAMGMNLRSDDYVCTTYRGLHDHLAKGVPLDLLWAEYLGRATGTCKGKGGPMHITHRESRMLLTTGIVGSGMPIGLGMGLAIQRGGGDQVVVVNFGDGASNIGAFHASLNLAAVWKLPVVFLGQNNRYAEHTPYAQGTSVPRVAARAAAYDVPGWTVDGNDAAQMHSVAGQAVARARAGEGPSLVEALTFRFYGHNVNDDNKYMAPGELQAARDASFAAGGMGWWPSVSSLRVDVGKCRGEQAVSIVGTSYDAPRVDELRLRPVDRQLDNSNDDPVMA